jgi:hypothetical protein
MEEEQGRTGEEEKRICKGGEIILGGRGRVLDSGKRQSSTRNPRVLTFDALLPLLSTKIFFINIGPRKVKPQVRGMLLISNIACDEHHTPKSGG